VVGPWCVAFRDLGFGGAMMSRKIALVLGLSLVACWGAVGCFSPGARPNTRMETLAETPDEHCHRADLILDRDRRALAEDLDLLFMTDRPTRLSKWHGR